MKILCLINIPLPEESSLNPRTLKMIHTKGIEFNLLMKTKAVLSDIGTISEESSILGFRALDILQAHERPQALEEAAVMMVGLKRKRILQGFEILKTQENYDLRRVNNYGMPDVSDKLLRIILS